VIYLSSRYKYFYLDNPEDYNLNFHHHENFKYLVRSDVLRVMDMSTAVILDVTPCSLVDGGTSTSLLGYTESSSRLAQLVMLMTCIWVVPGSNLSKDTNYPDSDFVIFLGPSR
jgi:hypothetical protein